MPGRKSLKRASTGSTSMNHLSKKRGVLEDAVDDISDPYEFRGTQSLQLDVQNSITPKSKIPVTSCSNSSITPNNKSSITPHSKNRGKSLPKTSKSSKGVTKHKNSPITHERKMRQLIELEQKNLKMAIEESKKLLQKEERQNRSNRRFQLSGYYSPESSFCSDINASLAECNVSCVHKENEPSNETIHDTDTTGNITDNFLSPEKENSLIGEDCVTPEVKRFTQHRVVNSEIIGGEGVSQSVLDCELGVPLMSIGLTHQPTLPPMEVASSTVAKEGQNDMGPVPQERCNDTCSITQEEGNNTDSVAQERGNSTDSVAQERDNSTDSVAQERDNIMDSVAQERDNSTDSVAQERDNDTSSIAQEGNDTGSTAQGDNDTGSIAQERDSDMGSSEDQLSNSVPELSMECNNNSSVNSNGDHEMPLSVPSSTLNSSSRPQTGTKCSKMILQAFDLYLTNLREAQDSVLQRIPWGAPIKSSRRQSRNSLDYRSRKSRTTIPPNARLKLSRKKINTNSVQQVDEFMEAAGPSPGALSRAPTRADHHHNSNQATEKKATTPISRIADSGRLSLSLKNRNKNNTTLNSTTKENETVENSAQLKGVNTSSLCAVMSDQSQTSTGIEEESMVVDDPGEVVVEKVGNELGALIVKGEHGSVVSESGEAVVEEGNEAGEIIVEEGNETREAVIEEGNETGEAVIEEGNETEEAIVEEGNETGEAVIEEEGNETGEAFIEEEGNETGEAVIEEDNETGEAVVEEGNETGEAVVEEGNETGEAVIEEDNETGEAVIEEGNETGEAVVEEGNKTGEAVVEEGNETGEAVVEEGNESGEAVIEEDNETGGAFSEADESDKMDDNDRCVTTKDQKTLSQTVPLLRSPRIILQRSNNVVTCNTKTNVMELESQDCSNSQNEQEPANSPQTQQETRQVEIDLTIDSPVSQRKSSRKRPCIYSSEDELACPICSIHFPIEEIAGHAASCGEDTATFDKAMTSSRSKFVPRARKQTSMLEYKSNSRGNFVRSILKDFDEIDNFSSSECESQTLPQNKRKKRKVQKKPQKNKAMKDNQDDIIILEEQPSNTACQRSEDTNSMGDRQSPVGSPEHVSCHMTEDGGFVVDPSTISDSPIHSYQKISSIAGRSGIDYNNQFVVTASSKSRSSSRGGGSSHGRGNSSKSGYQNKKGKWRNKGKFNKHPRRGRGGRK